MKTSPKRRVLISSVAMLLVAMLALGTATYAWFTVDTKATADGLKVQTSKTSSLLISDATMSKYDTAFSYAPARYMIPTSSINAKNWYSATADAEDSYKSTTAAKLVDLTTSPKQYVFRDQLNIWNSGEVAVNDVKIVVSGFNNHNYLRFALVEVDGKGVGKTVAEADFRKNVYANDEVAYNPVKPTSATDTTGVYSTAAADQITPIQVTGDTFEIPVSTSLAADSYKYYNLYVWFEGQDPDCKNANAGTGTSDGSNNTPNGLTFEVTGTPQTQS